MRLIRYLIQVQERRRFDFRILFFFSIFTGIVRALEEMLFFQVPLKNSEVVTFVAFYLSLGYYLTFILSKVSGVPWRRVNLAVVIGIFLGTFPPMIDFLFFPAEKVFYGYFFIWNLNELPWLGYQPRFNFPPGEAITIWLSIGFAVIYVALKTRSIWRSLLALFFVYLAFIFHGSLLPMSVVRLYYGLIPSIQELSRVDSIRMAPMIYYIALWQVVVTIVVYLGLRRELAFHLLKRIPHTLPFVIISALGGRLVDARWTDLILIAVFVLLAALGTLVQNDWFDRREDRHPAPVDKNDVVAFNIFFFLGISFLFMLNMRAVIPIVLAYAVSFLYNYPFYRARNSFPGNLKIEGVWGGSVFLAGLLSAPLDSIARSHLIATFLIFGGWSLVAALKDAKDITTDHANNVRTYYTILLNRGVSFRRSHQFLRAIVMIVFAVPAVFLFVQNQPVHAVGALFLGPVTMGILTLLIDSKGFKVILLAVTSYLGYFLALAEAGILKL